jgi:hypothetical protein
MEFPFIFSSVLRKSQLKACTHTPENICITLYIILSMILQLCGLLFLYVAITLAEVVAEVDYVRENNKTGNFEFWYE